MRRRSGARIAAIAALAVAAAVAPASGASKKAVVHYRVVKLDTLGGTAGGGNSIDNRGWVTGLANLSGDQTAHAALWLGADTVDLGTLGGPNSAVSWPVKSENGLIAGISETGDDQPLGEVFSCAAFFGTPHTGKVCRGFAWSDGAMTKMPTLGGDNSYAAGADDTGRVVGWAENSVHDGTCTPPQVLQFRAVIWRPGDGSLQELRPIGDDTSSAATAINDLGQVVGISGSCDRARGRFSAAHAVLWEGGVPRELPNLGGVAWNTPTAINHHGDSAGFSDFAGDQGGGLNAHAVLWPRGGGLVDLGVIGDDPLSLAFGINDRGQIVGQSIGDSGSRAFLYENGTIENLNDLVDPGSPYLIYANDINDRGEIAGQGCTACDTGETFAVRLIPYPAAGGQP
jgi:probable HAF family extracellular repeat protein